MNGQTRRRLAMVDSQNAAVFWFRGLHIAYRCNGQNGHRESKKNHHVILQVAPKFHLVRRTVATGIDFSVLMVTVPGANFAINRTVKPHRSKRKQSGNPSSLANSLA